MHCSATLGLHAWKEQCPPPCPRGLAWCNGLPATHYSYKVSANHTIDPVIPPIWNSLPQLAVSMSKVQVSVSPPASLCRPPPACHPVSGEVIETCVPSPHHSLVFFLVFIRHRLHGKEKSVAPRRNANADRLIDLLPFWLLLCGAPAARFVEFCCAVMCCIFLFLSARVCVAHVEVVTSVNSGGNARGWSLRLGTLMEYQ